MNLENMPADEASNLAASLLEDYKVERVRRWEAVAEYRKKVKLGNLCLGY